MLGLFKGIEVSLLPLLPHQTLRGYTKGAQHREMELITDFSQPPGASVNDSTEPDLCSLTYQSVDQAAEVAGM